jgi:hypothetical protein
MTPAVHQSAKPLSAVLRLTGVKAKTARGCGIGKTASHFACLD